MTKKSNPKFHLSPSGKAINVFVWEYLRAAKKLNLKYRFITPDYDSVERYAEIYNQQKTIRIFRAYKPINDAVSSAISDNKVLTHNLLKENNISVPEQRIIKNLQELNKIIPQIKYPVVVKPIFLSKGKGITANIQNTSELILAFKAAQEISQKEIPNNIHGKTCIIIEEMIAGFDHRLTVLSNKVIAVVKKNPAQIVGDGQSTIEEMIAIENQSPLRLSSKISTIKIDNDLLQALKNQGLSLKSIAPKNQKIILHYVSNLSRGGTTENVTDQTHPGFKKIAIKAAKIVGLKFAGIDIITQNISQSPQSQKYAVLETNSHPGSRLHLYPTFGQPVDVPRIVLKKLFNL